jgi:hypothetical protein
MAQETAQPAGLFNDINNLRGEWNEKEEIAKEQEALEKFNANTCCGRLARNSYFEYITLGIIIFNALYLGYDANYSAMYGKPDDLYGSDMPLGFTVMENLFCLFFTGELLIRFFGYVKKVTCLTDIAFLFDLVLVALMVVETWILAFLGAGGALSQLSILRLLRLVRILRMGKLLRYFPELALIVKGMAAAVRSVGCAAILLMMVLYVFSIVFTSEYHQGWKTDKDVNDAEDEILQYFGTMGKSMRHLFIMGTILDDITAGLNAIRGTDKIGMVLCFLAVVLISAFTLFNMLLGILCEVVDATSAGEKMHTAEKNLNVTIEDFFKTMDIDGDGMITRSEFRTMKDTPKIMHALEELDIDHKALEKYEPLFFDDEGGGEKSLSHDVCIQMLMMMRPGNDINCCDFAYFSKKIQEKNDEVRSYLDRVEWFVEQLKDDDEEEEDEVGNEELPLDAGGSYALGNIYPERGGTTSQATSGSRLSNAQRGGRASRLNHQKNRLVAWAQSPAAEAAYAPWEKSTKWTDRSPTDTAADTLRPRIGSPSAKPSASREVVFVQNLDGITEKRRIRNAEMQTAALANKRAMMTVNSADSTARSGNLPEFPDALRHTANPKIEDSMQGNSPSRCVAIVRTV